MEQATAVGLEKYNTEMRIENSKPRILNREANYQTNCNECAKQFWGRRES